MRVTYDNNYQHADNINNGRPIDPHYLPLITMTGVDVYGHTTTGATSYPVDATHWIHCKFWYGTIHKDHLVARILCRLKEATSSSITLTTGEASSDPLAPVALVGDTVTRVLEDGIYYRYIDLSRYLHQDPAGEYYFVIMSSGSGTLNLSTTMQFIVDYTGYDEQRIDEAPVISLSSSDRDIFGVNTLNGRGTYTCRVMGADCARLPWALSAVYDPLTYNNTSVQSLPLFAKGWRWNWAQAIYQSGNKYIYWDADRKEHIFVQCANNSDVYYEKSVNSGLYIVFNGTSAIMTDDISVQMTFTNGRLTAYATLGVGAGSMTFTYDSLGRLSTITDDYGDIYTIDYSSANLIKIKCGTTPFAELAISSSKLSTITRKNQDCSTTIVEPSTQFSYDTTGRLVTIYSTDTHGKVSVTYNASHRVLTMSKVSQGTSDMRAEQHIKMVYRARRTSVCYARSAVDPVYMQSIYVFDTLGRCIATYEGEVDNLLSNTANTKVDDDNLLSFSCNTAQEVTNLVFSGIPLSINGNINQLLSFEIPTDGLSQSKRYLLAAKVTIGRSATNVNAKVTIEQINYPHTLRSVDMADSGDQLLLVPIDASSSGVISLRVKATGYNGSCTIESFKLWTCIGIDTGDYVSTPATGSSALALAGYNWYFVKKCNLKYISVGASTEVSLVDVRITAKDIERTRRARVYTKNHSSLAGWNVWYGDGQMLYNVSSCKYSFLSSETFLNLEQFESSHITCKFDRYVISSLQVFSSYTEYQYRTFRATTSGYTTERIWYNDAHLPIKHITPEGEKVTISYTGTLPTSEAIGANTSSTPDMIQRDKTYNSLGLLLSETTYRESEDNTVTYQYGSDHRLFKMDIPSIYELHYYNYAHDPDKLWKITQNIYRSNTINFDGENISSMVNCNNGTSIGFGYNQYNDPASVTIVGTAQSYAMSKTATYNTDGTITMETTKGGQTLRRTYDCYGRLNKIDRLPTTGAVTVRTYIYNDTPITDQMIVDPDNASLHVTSSSRLYRICDWIDGVLTRADYTYDHLGRVTEIIVTRSGAVLYQVAITYDQYSRLHSYCLKQGEDVLVDRIYVYMGDVSDCVDLVTNAIANEAWVHADKQVDALRRTTQKSITYTTPLFQTYKHRTLYTYYAADTGGTTADVKKVTYELLHSGVVTSSSNESIEYDDNGNVIAYGNKSYAYDGYNRLIREDNGDYNRTFVYEYDNAGNVTSKKTYTYNSTTLLSTQNHTFDPTWKELLVAVDNQSCVYNAAGQPTTYRGDTFTWEKGLLRTAHGVSIYYDGEGTRFRKGNIKYYYQAGKLLMQTDGTTDLRFLYDEDDVIGFQQVAGNTKTLYFYRRNLFGDVIAIYNESNTLLARYIYDAWGNHKVLNPDGSENTSSTFIGNINPLRYRGYYYDSDLGLYYCKARYYDPITCRWISMDDISFIDPWYVDGMNLFSYCGNNPIAYYDDTGRKRRYYSPFKGWSIVIDTPVIDAHTKKHIHLSDGNKEYSQNIDGTEHDASKGNPPKSLQKYLRKKGIWDWIKKDAIVTVPPWREWMPILEPSVPMTTQFIPVVPDYKSQVETYPMGRNYPPAIESFPIDSGYDNSNVYTTTISVIAFLLWGMAYIGQWILGY